MIFQDIFSQMRKKFITLNRVELSKKALYENIAYFKSLFPRGDIIPMLKSNAYGHGLKEISLLLKDVSIPLLWVDGYFEAKIARRHSKKDVLILWYTLPINIPNIDTEWFEFVVYDHESIEAFWKLGKRVKLHLKIDTGMHRQWIHPDELDAYLEYFKSYKHLILQWVCSHFLDADIPNSPHTQLQLDIFKKCVDEIHRKWYIPKYIHISNTAWALQKLWNDFCTAQRIGIGIYGISPFWLSKEYPFYKKLSPVMRVISTLIQKKYLKKWEVVSYNGIFQASENMEIGVIPFGYYEGLPRNIGDEGMVYVKNIPLKILGRVCMNLSMIQLWANSGNVWETIEVISPDVWQKNSLYQIASQSKKIPYEICVWIAPTIRRKIIETFEKEEIGKE